MKKVMLLFFLICVSCSFIPRKDFFKREEIKRIKNFYLPKVLTYFETSVGKPLILFQPLHFKKSIIIEREILNMLKEGIGNNIKSMRQLYKQKAISEYLKPTKYQVFGPQPDSTSRVILMCGDKEKSVSILKNFDIPIFKSKTKIGFIKIVFKSVEQGLLFSFRRIQNSDNQWQPNRFPMKRTDGIQFELGKIFASTVVSRMISSHVPCGVKERIRYVPIWGDKRILDKFGHKYNAFIVDGYDVWIDVIIYDNKMNALLRFIGLVENIYLFANRKINERNYIKAVKILVTNFINMYNKNLNNYY